MELYENGLRLGYTTGTCAAGAAYAGALLLEGENREKINILTPAGIDVDLDVLDLHMDGEWAVAAIRKDSGDDPDVTDKILIYAKIRKTQNPTTIDGGVGIGTITKKGLYGEIGEKAINPVPKKMILEAVQSVSDDNYEIIIFVPDGETVGKRTYNSNLGIVGGISIIGSTGIVHPMSEDALLKTIELEVNVVKEEHGTDNILLVPGNYGEKMQAAYKLDIPHVQMSNYIGDALKYAYQAGFRNITLLGHIGKFSKLSLGIFNTHSKNCDTRMEAFAFYLFLLGAPRDFIMKVLSLNTAEEAMNLCVESGYKQAIIEMQRGAEARIKRYLKDPDLNVRVYIYSMEGGLVDD